MICWGERNCCGVFMDRSKDDRCDCLRDYCIRDFEPEQRVMVNESELYDAIDHVYGKSEDNFHELDEMLALRSISTSLEYQKETRQIIDRLAQRLSELEFDVEVVEVKPKDDKEPTNYVIFANYFSTPAKNVLLVYGHVDVKSVNLDDGWTQPPFKLTREDEMLYGRGLTSSKGPVLCWLQAAEAWMESTNDLPVNLRFVIDTFSHAHNQALRDVIDQRKQFFRGVDLLVGSTNLWITPTTPMLSTSHSGYIYFELEVRSKKRPKKGETPTRDPMSELCLLMNTLMDQESCLAKNLQRHVLPVTQHDWDILSIAEVGIMEYKEQLDVKQLPHEQSMALFLKHRWCMPGLTMHGVEQRHYQSQRDLHLPQRIVARFSVKLVPDQSVEYVSSLVRQHLDCAYSRLKCQQPAYLRPVDAVAPLIEARNAPFTLAARRSYERIYDVQAAIPDTATICMPMLNELRRHCLAKAQVIGLPFCSVHMHPGQVDESMTSDEYQKNQELCTTLMYELALVPPECKCTELKDFCYQKGKATELDFIRMSQPRNPNLSHVLYELNEAQIDRTPSIGEAFPKLHEILLGKANKKQLD